MSDEQIERIRELERMIETLKGQDEVHWKTRRLLVAENERLTKERNEANKKHFLKTAEFVSLKLHQEEREASLACAEMEADANSHIAQQIVDENAKLRAELSRIKEAIPEEEEMNAAAESNQSGESEQFAFIAGASWLRSRLTQKEGRQND